MHFVSRFSAMLGNTEGSNLVELALALPMLLLILVAAVDLGEAFYTGVQLSGSAHDGALYGIHNPTDITGMKSAAQNGSANLSGFVASATYGCECSDGSAAVSSCGAPPICTSNYVNYVDVTVTASYSPIISFAGVPSPSTFRSEARMRAGGN
jgi:Flp pilus assembly protein TadG